MEESIKLLKRTSQRVFNRCKDYVVAHIIAFIVTFVCATFALIARSQFAASDIFFPMEFVKLANHDISHRLLPVVANILQILLNSFQNNVSGIVFFV